MTTKPKTPRQYPHIGWREWVSLPDLGIQSVKAKIDTGARSSAIHVEEFEIIEENGVEIVQFTVHPIQKNSEVTVQSRAKLLEIRSVKSSDGSTSDRPVIETDVGLLGQQWSIELTLANRDSMGFRMLLGRQAVRDRFLIDAGQSYFGGRPEKAHT